MPDYEDDLRIDRFDRKKDNLRIKTKRKTEIHQAEGGIFDSFTTDNLSKMISKEIIGEFVGIISAGKEANVYYARDSSDNPLAVKIYKIDPQNTKWMKNYIIGDPRFKKIGTSTHKIIYTWCRKEYKNLQQLERTGIRVPKPIAFKDNILVMQFLGETEGSPAPRLKDSHREINSEDFQDILQLIKNMYIHSHLVHGDLSEFNILDFEGKQWIIDVSQAVSIYHMNAPAFLMRDLKNIINFYQKILGDECKIDYEEMMHEIVREAQSS